MNKLSWWKVCLILLGAFLVFTLLYGIGSGILMHFMKEPLKLIPIGIALCILYTFIYAGALWKMKKSWLPTISYKKIPLETTKGIIIGLLLFCLSVGIMAALGCYRFGSPHFHFMYLLGQLIFFLFVGICEEVIFRGILFKIVEEKWGTLIALVVSSVFFGFVHIINENATLWSSIAIVIEAGLLLGMAYKYSGTLWLPIGIHWIWNYTQGPILGFAVSGNNVEETLFTPTIQGPHIITGGSFGAEASIITTLLGFAFCILLWYLYKRKEQM